MSTYSAKDIKEILGGAPTAPVSLLALTDADGTQGRDTDRLVGEILKDSWEDTDGTMGKMLSSQDVDGTHGRNTHRRILIWDS